MAITVQDTKLKLGYKQTEVGVIPEDWVVKTLGEIVNKERPICYGIVQTGKSVDNGVSCIRVVDLNNGKIKKENLITTSNDISNSYKRTILKEGDLVIALRGKIGELAIIDKELIGSNLTRGVALIAVNDSLDSSFFLQQLSSYNSKVIFERNLNGSALQEIPINVLRKIPVAYPRTKSEQTSIATVLSDTDSLITSLDKLIAKKRDIKQATMQQLLTGKTRLPGFSGEWVVKKLGEIAQSTAGGTPSTLIKEYWGGNIKWMNSGELNAKKVYDVEGRITEEGLKNSSAKIIPSRCILVGLAGQGKTRGTIAINMVELCTNQSIAAIFPSHQLIPEYLYFNLDSRYDELRNLSTGEGGRGGLNLRIINSLTIPLPSLAEQTAIATILSDMDAEIAALEQKRDKTRALKQGMMQELLTGKTRLI